MTALNLINFNIPFLNTSDTVESAIEMMEDLRLEQMVYSNGIDYLGVFSLDILQNIANTNTFLVDVLPNYPHIFANYNQHIIELVQLTQKTDLQVIGVIGDDFRIKGTILVTDLILKYGGELGNNEIGAIITLSIDKLDYSLAEIARLIESNNAKILSSYYKTEAVDDYFLNTLTIKLNTEDISRIVATLERFGYRLLNTYANEPLESPEKERFELLMRYLEI